MRHDRAEGSKTPPVRVWPIGRGGYEIVARLLKYSKNIGVGLPARVVAQNGLKDYWPIWLVRWESRLVRGSHGLSQTSRTEITLNFESCSQPVRLIETSKRL